MPSPAAVTLRNALRTAPNTLALVAKYECDRRLQSVRNARGSDDSDSRRFGDERRVRSGRSELVVGAKVVLCSEREPSGCGQARETRLSVSCCRTCCRTSWWGEVLFEGSGWCWRHEINRLPDICMYMYERLLVHRSLLMSRIDRLRTDSSKVDVVHHGTAPHIQTWLPDLTQIPGHIYSKTIPKDVRSTDKHCSSILRDQLSLS